MIEVINIPDRERAKDALILQLSQGRDKLAARVEALEADAARYRWLRGAGNSMLGRFGGYTSTNADSVIDAAMKENQT